MFKNFDGKFNVMIKQLFLHIPIKLLTKGYHVEFQPYRSSPAGVIEGYLERYNSVHTLFWDVPLQNFMNIQKNNHSIKHMIT